MLNTIKAKGLKIKIVLCIIPALDIFVLKVKFCVRVIVEQYLNGYGI